MRRLAARLIFPILQIRSTHQLALASSVGMILAFLPLNGWQWGIAFALSLILQLHLFSLFVGICTYALIPILFWSANRWFHMDLSHPSTLLLNTLGNEWLSSMTVGIIAGLVFYLPFQGLYANLRKRRYLQEQASFVFEDFGRRWRYTRRVSILLFIIIIGTGFVVWDGINQKPIISPNSSKKPTIYLTDGIKPIQEPLSEEQRAKLSTSSKLITPAKFTPKKEVTAFYVPWDPKSWLQLKEYEYIKQIHILIPQWYSLSDSKEVIEDLTQPQVDQLAKQHKVKIMPLLNNVYKGKWDTKVLHNWIGTEKKRSQLIQELLQRIQKNGYQGINIDFEGVEPKDKNNLTLFIKELSQVFDKHNLEVTQDVPASDASFDYQSLAKYADQLYIMMYDEHFATGKPGPIASSGWVQDTLKKLPVPKDKRTIILGSYGYDWVVGSDEPAQSITFDEVMTITHDTKTPIHWDSTSRNSYIRYQRGDAEHIAWFADATVLANQIALLGDENKIALWRLGSEDRSLWELWNTGQIEKIQSIPSEVPVLVGQGDFIRIHGTGKEGSRSFKLNQAGFITDVKYARSSEPIIVEQFGKSKEKKLALTFDDGPDPAYTGQILDILKEHGVKAAFFIVGQNAIQYPDLIKRMVEEGHEVGHHTYSHQEINKLNQTETDLQLNITQRFFQQLTSRSMMLFRPPYNAEATLTNTDELHVIQKAQTYGYLTLGQTIDSQDWNDATKESILIKIKNQLRNGNVILFHDSGGDRTATVEALPVVIKGLKQAGYQIVPVHQLSGFTKEQTMPKVVDQDQTWIESNKVAFGFVSLWSSVFQGIMHLTIGIGFFRVLMLMYLSYQQLHLLRRRKRTHNFNIIRTDYNPVVSVVIAAYNEEKVISKTIASVLASDYDPIEVIVVNDGSTDRTEGVMLSQFGNHPHVGIVTISNGGKTNAVNLGFEVAQGEIIVTIDADTLIAKDAISNLVRHFVDPKVAAVSGNVKVGNLKNLLTLWQHVEYITGFNLERRAFDNLNSIPVVPGAIGAWRKKAVEDVGLYQHNTLAEDTDLTIQLLREGYKVEYEDKAYAFTEVPEDVKSFIKQRTRWIYGTLQCLWKHREALFSGKQGSLGFVTLPNMWIFQYGVQMVSPFVDILCIISFFTDQAWQTFLFYLAFLAFDSIAAFFAFSLEKENPRPLIWLFLQRFAYRQIMTYIVAKSLLLALKGVTVGWNKLVRTGSAKMDQTPNM